MEPESPPQEEPAPRQGISYKVALAVGLALAVVAGLVLAGRGDDDGGSPAPGPGGETLSCEELGDLHIQAAAALAERVRAVRESAPAGETGEAEHARMLSDPEVAARQQEVDKYIRAQQGCTND